MVARLCVLVLLAAFVAGTAAGQAQHLLPLSGARVGTVCGPVAVWPPPPDPSAPSLATEWWLAGTTVLIAPDGARAAVYGVDAISVWQRSRGQGVVVADIDTGVDPHQQELRGALLKGRGFGQCHWPDHDADGHGTQVASLIVGRGVKLSGVAPGAKLLELAALDMFGNGDPADIAAALRYAAQRDDVRVVNVPLGTRRVSPAIRTAVRANLRAGKLVVAAAGNGGGDAARMIPCSYYGVVCVGASEPTGKLARFSNYGTPVALSAPGDNLLVADTTVFYPGRTRAAYDLGAGTSFASALVSGVAALLFSAHPQASAGDVRHALLAGLYPVGARSGRILSPGIVDAAASLKILDTITSER